MKVTDLLTLLEHLSLGLRPIAGSAFPKEIDQCRAALSAFGNLTVAELGVFLAKCEQYKRDGTIPVKGGAKPAVKKPGGKAAEQEATARDAMAGILAAINGGTADRARIKAAVDALSALTLAGIEKVIAEAGLPLRVKPKAKMLAAVGEALDNRAEAAMRVQTMRADR